MNLQGKKIVILAEDLYEDLELWYPRLRLKEEGADVTVAGPAAGTEYRAKHGYPVRTEVAASEIDPGGVDALIIPGGYAPDRMRRNEDVLELVTQVFRRGAVVAFICHAGWVPISARILKGRRATSFFAIKDDMVNAGAQWVDQAVVRDGNLISSRTPADLPAFCREIIGAVSE